MWKAKTALMVVLTVFFCVPYFALQRFLLFNPRTLPVSALDRAIVFDPRWTWVYQSVYLLLIALPWMASTRSDLRRYATGFVAVSSVGFACFLLLPVHGPRPAGVVTDFMFRVLQSYDRPLNCFPSLHIGLAVYTVLFAARILERDSTARRVVVSLGWLWTTLIAYAALATKQHYAIDLPAGALLAYAGHWCVWRNTQRSTPHAEPSMARADRSRDPGDVLVRKPHGHAVPDASILQRR